MNITSYNSTGATINSSLLINRIEKDANTGYIILYSELDTHIEKNDIVYLTNIEGDNILDNYKTYKDDDNFPFTSYNMGYNVVDVDKEVNKIIIDKFYDDLVIETNKNIFNLSKFIITPIKILKLTAENCKVNSSYIENTVVPDILNCEIYQAILINGTYNQCIFKAKYNDNYLSRKIFEGGDDAIYVDNNEQYGYTYSGIFSKSGITFLQECELERGTFNNCNIETLNRKTITYGNFSNCTISNYIINGGDYIDCIICGTTIWNNGNFTSYSGYNFHPLIWNNGNWNYGIFSGKSWLQGSFNGNFINSNWSGGTFNNGNFINSIWKTGTFTGSCYMSLWSGGTFNSGTFSASTWLDGVWRKGNFESSLWKNGTFQEGSFNNSFWTGGTFGNYLKTASFNNSIWYNGTFIGGIFEDSYWYSGTCLNCDFISSTWEKGVFSNGNFENSLWSGGTWNGSKTSNFYNSVWYNGNWIEGKATNSEFNNLYWKNGNMYECKLNPLSTVNWSGGTMFNTDFIGSSGKTDITTYIPSATVSGTTGLRISNTYSLISRNGFTYYQYTILSGISYAINNINKYEKFSFFYFDTLYTGSTVYRSGDTYNIIMNKENVKNISGQTFINVIEKTPSDDIIYLKINNSGVTVTSITYDSNNFYFSCSGITTLATGYSYNINTDILFKNRFVYYTNSYGESFEQIFQNLTNTTFETGNLFLNSTMVSKEIYLDKLYKITNYNWLSGNYNYYKFGGMWYSGNFNSSKWIGKRIDGNILSPLIAPIIKLTSKTLPKIRLATGRSVSVKWKRR